MPLTARQIVRVYIGDKIKSAVQEFVGVGDGVNKMFQTDMFPLVTNTITIFVTGVAAASAAASIDFDTGKIEFAVAPTNGNNLVMTYNYSALTDGEIDEIMSGVGTGKTLLVAANCCLALAADASRWFSYVMGDKEVNKNDIGAKLMKLAEDLENKYYRQRDDSNFNITIATLADLPTGTPYYGYDSGLNILDEE